MPEPIITVFEVDMAGNGDGCAETIIVKTKEKTSR